jgi:hypothetical protein
MRWGKLTVGKEQLVRAQGSIEVLLGGNLVVLIRAALPRPSPEIRGHNADGGGRGGDEDVSARFPSGFENVYGAIPVHGTDAAVKEWVTFLRPDSSRGVEDSQGQLGDRLGPRLQEGGFDRRPGGNIGFHEITAGSRLDHVPSVERHEINDTDALGRFATLEQLQDNVSSHEA